MFRRGMLCAMRRAEQVQQPLTDTKGSGVPTQRPGSWTYRDASDHIPTTELARRFYDEYFNHKYLGFFARCTALCGVLGLFGLGIYRLIEFSQETVGLAKRWLPRWHEITFLERIREGDTDVFVYRFALPNSYDYLGYDSVTSCELLVPNSKFFPTKRFFTPISHPDQRGIVEFAMKHHPSGMMTSQLQQLEPGDRIWMGKWLREWRYKPNRHKDVGMLMANSGVSPTLQILVNALDDPNDMTKFHLLYFNRNTQCIPFREKLLAIQDKYPDRFRVTFTVDSTMEGEETRDVIAAKATKMLTEYGAPKESFYTQHGGSRMAYDTGARGQVEPVKLLKMQGNKDFDGFVGLVTRDLVMEACPPPTSDTMMLCCGPQAFMSLVCGRPVNLLRSTYVEGFYYGILKDMGYSWSQVYKFGTSWSSSMVDAG